MWKLRPVSVVLLLCLFAALAVGQRSQWRTLTGDEPLVIARGGFSGLFPDSSDYAYAVALSTSLSNVILWCDVQLTKDAAGICFPNLRLENASDIDSVSQNKQKTYVVNGVSMQGWFPLDFTLKELALVSLMQGIYSRSPSFDGLPQQILTVETVSRKFRPPGLWLNIQYDSFYSQQNLSMRNFVLSVSRSVVVNYISSPEVAFLRSIVARFKPSQTKLVFRFLKREDVEPSTNQTYDSLLKNLTFIKTFAYGILVPKSYIQPVLELYSQPYTSVVSDAHKAGLAVFACDFANDVPLAYNFSYDPVAEYLSFMDNGEFSVDGVLSDFPVTASASIDCFSHMRKQDAETAKLLVISSEGASGDYPGCSDLAYSKAIFDGVDVLDCPIQLTQDGIPFCLGSINLIDRTNVVQTVYGSTLTSIPDLKIQDGFYAFNISWSKIQQGLKPAIANPYTNYTLYRNPNARNGGKFVSLSDFLALAKSATSVSGVMISIEHAVYLAREQGLDVTGAVLDALDRAGYSNQTVKKVMIRSTDSSVLEKLKKNGYELVYELHDDVRDIMSSTISKIKSFASSVVVHKLSILPTNNGFVVGLTNVATKLKASGLAVYVQPFHNEFISQAWDYFSDPYVQINTFVQAGNISGVVTDFPATANKYRRNRCLGYKKVPPYMLPAEPGALLSLMAPSDLPPAQAPSPILSDADVVESPFPAVVKKSPSTAAAGPLPSAGGPEPKSGQGTIAANVFLSSFAVLFASRILS